MAVTTFQVCPDAPIAKLSDNPCKVHGVKYQPKWAWSNDYRREFRRTYGRVKQTETDESLALEYARLIMERRGLASVHEASDYLRSTGSMNHPL